MSDSDPIQAPEDHDRPLWPPTDRHPYEVSITLRVESTSATSLLLELADNMRLLRDVTEVDVHVEKVREG